MLIAPYLDAATYCNTGLACFVGNAAFNVPRRQYSAPATTFPPPSRANASVRHASLRLSSLASLRELGLPAYGEGTEVPTLKLATTMPQWQPGCHKWRHPSRVEQLLLSPLSPSGLDPAYSAAPLRQSRRDTLSSIFSRSSDGDSSRYQNCWPHTVCHATERGAAGGSDDGKNPSAEHHMDTDGSSHPKPPTRRRRRGDRQNIDSEGKDAAIGDGDMMRSSAAARNKDGSEESQPGQVERHEKSSPVPPDAGVGVSQVSAKRRSRSAKDSMSASSQPKRSRSGKTAKVDPDGDQDDATINPASRSGTPRTSSLPKTEKSAGYKSSRGLSDGGKVHREGHRQATFGSKGISDDLSEMVTSSLKRGRRRGGRTKQDTGEGEKGAEHTGKGMVADTVQRDGDSGLDVVGISGAPTAPSSLDGEVFANRVMLTQGAFDKRGDRSIPSGELESGKERGCDREKQHIDDVMANSVIPTLRAFDRKGKEGLHDRASSDPPERFSSDEQPHSPSRDKIFPSRDGDVYLEDLEKDEEEGEEDEIELLCPLEVAAMLVEQRDSQRHARRVDLDVRSRDSPASLIDETITVDQLSDSSVQTAPCGENTAQDAEVDERRRADGALAESQETDEDGISYNDDLHTEPFILDTLPKGEGDGLEEVFNNIELANTLPPAEEPTTSIIDYDVSGKDKEGTADDSMVTSASLKERLRMTDEEIQALRSDYRSGLSNDRSVERKLTGAASGQADSAMGYLLNELRMKPAEAKEAVLRCPQLLKLTARGPHGVASWLQGGLGLSADDVAKMVRRHPSILTYSIIHNMRPKFRWLQEELGLTRARAIRLVTRCPGVFGLSIDENMFPKLEWLQIELRLTRKEAASVVFGNPGVLLNNVERSLEPKIDWMVHNLHLEREMVIDMIRRYPMFFSLSSDGNLGPKLKWLAEHSSNEIVRRVIFRQPSLLGHSVQGTLAPKVQWLQDRLGMSADAAWTVIGKSPGFLTLSIADTLEPKLWWMRDKLDMTLQGAAKLVSVYPTLFDLSIEDSLEPKLWWVRDALGLDRPDAAAVLRRCPQIFGSSLKETLEPKISWLARRLKTTRQRVAGMVLKFPQLLTYSIDRNLSPTIDFFQYDMGDVELEDVLAVVEARPSVLSTSLDKRLTVRVAKMRKAGVEPHFRSHVQPVTRLTDKDFKVWLKSAKAHARRLDQGITGDTKPVSKSLTESAPPTDANSRATSSTVISGKQKKRPTVATKNVARENL